jgi:hypothetical protein
MLPIIAAAAAVAKLAKSTIKPEQFSSGAWIVVQQTT